MNMTTSVPPGQVARGSSSRVSAVSTPRQRADTPLSAFQLPEETRQSQLDMALRRPSSDNTKAYIIVIVVLALCVIALLGFLLVL
jgi:hypothetical protein